MPTGFLSEPATDLGQRLRDLRVTHGYSQAELAEILGTRANRVSDWETGKHEPSLTLLVRIAQAYGITVAILLCGVM